MAHTRKVPYRFCNECWTITPSCSCIRACGGIFANPFIERKTVLDLGGEEESCNSTVFQDGIEAQGSQSVNDFYNFYSCPKNAQHDEFIPVNDFTTNHLPEALKHVSFYVWLRNCIPLVVRIVGIRGGRDIVASGRATLLPQDLRNTQVCLNTKCPYKQLYGSKHEVYGGIGIITNKHVVQNDDDAKNSTVEFFYHDDENRLFNIIKEQGFHVYMTNHKMDYTTFACYTHKKDLLAMIATFDKIRDFIWQRIPRQIRLNSKQYAIVISHPHGTSKKISIGTVIERQTRYKSDADMANIRTLRDIYNTCLGTKLGSGTLRFAEYIRLLPDLDLSFTITWYTTATCKGSSGAPVFMGNVVKENGEEVNQAHTHRGVDDNLNLNNCFT